ncbi:MAG: endolytic transglycosylase MltG [Candidatus Levybacteria bacterium]|nr:endolytic transglycosylase MltG [Candidatus Levybacteria bacterium]
MKKLLTLFLVFTIFFLGLFFWWKNGLSAVNSADKTQKIFVIQKGEGVREIANKLKREGLIKDAVVFFIFVKKEGLDGKIQAGDFRLSPSMTAFDIAQTLTHGTLDVWVTIPEGKRAEEIAEILKISVPSYQSSWRNELVKHEGYLFPDTYLIPKDADIDLVITIMKNNFEKKLAAIWPSNKQSLFANKTRLSKEEVIIVASMIEREAKFEQDRPLVASVILNRIEIGMKLDIDATIQYALGYQEDEKTWWKKGLTKDDLAVNSSYNTYLNRGLPPAPISNPGLAVMRAVINSEDTNYLYYISDRSGKNHYAKTLEEHNANIERYGL